MNFSGKKLSPVVASFPGAQKVCECKAVFQGSMQHHRQMKLIKIIFSGKSLVVQSSSPVQWIETPGLV